MKVCCADANRPSPSLLPSIFILSPHTFLTASSSKLYELMFLFVKPHKHDDYHEEHNELPKLLSGRT